MNHKHWVAGLLLLVIIAGCAKNNDLLYPAEQSALNIWLGVDSQKPDSLVYNYAFKSLNDIDTVWFSVRLSGVPQTADREFNLHAVGGDTLRVKKGLHYDLPKYLLKAGAYEGKFPILVRRSSDFKDKPARLILELQEDKMFIKGVKERADLIIHFKEEFSKPVNWDVDPLPFYRLSSFFGIYSNVKFQFITTVIGRTPTFKVRYSGVLVPPDEVSYTQAQYWQARCKTELLQYNAEHPLEPLKNENNELITFP